MRVSMNRCTYHLLLAVIVSSVVLMVNILAFHTNKTSTYLFMFDTAYAIGNSAHFVSLAISDKEMEIKDEKNDFRGFLISR